MILNQLSNIVIIFFLILSSYFTFKKKYRELLVLFIFGIGLGGFSIYYGTLWFPYKIVSIFILIIFLLNTKKIKIPSVFSVLLIILTYALFIGILNQPSIDQSNIPTLQRSYIRPFIQFFTYISLASIIPFIVYTIKNSEDFEQFIVKYFRIVEFVIIFAVLQLILLKMGIDFMPILRPNVSDSKTATFHYYDLEIIRLYGITGEPKALSGFLFPYFFLSLFRFYKSKYNRNYYYHLIFLIISFIVIINTFSTSVLISISITLVFTSLIWFKDKIIIFVPLIVVLFLIQSFTEYFLATAGYGSVENINLFDVLFQRTAVRLEIEHTKRPELLAIEYLINEKPYLILTGLGLGMYPYYITSGGFWGIDPIDSNWVVFLLDLGLIGVIFLIFIFNDLLKLRKVSIFKNDTKYNSSLILLISSYLMGIGLGSYLYMTIFLGLTFAVKNLIINDFKN